MLKGYIFIFGIDNPSRSLKIQDRIISYKETLMIYKNVDIPDKVGLAIMDIRE